MTQLVIPCDIPYMGNIWLGKILVNHAIGEKKIGKQATVSAYCIYVFHVSVNIDE